MACFDVPKPLVSVAMSWQHNGERGCLYRLSLYPQAARCVSANARLGLGGSLIAVPIPAEAEADGVAVESATAAALREAGETGVRSFSVVHSMFFPPRCAEADFSQVLIVAPLLRSTGVRKWSDPVRAQTGG